MFNATILGQVFVNGVGLSAIYILVALGFTLLFGIMRVVNFAHGEFAMLGAFALFHLIKDWHWPWLVALPVGVITVALASLVLEWLVFRWFYQRMFESMIGLLGLNMMMMFGAILFWDVHERNIPPVSSEILMLGDIIVPVDRLIVVVIALTALAAFYAFIRGTRSGLAMRAAAQDLEIAETQGVNTRRIYKIAFFVAILLAALAGRAMGPDLRRVTAAGRAAALDGLHRRHPRRHGLDPRRRAGRHAARLHRKLCWHLLWRGRLRLPVVRRGDRALDRAPLGHPWNAGNLR